VGLNSILSPCAALLVENAEIAYFGVDWSVWSRRAIKFGNAVSFDVSSRLRWHQGTKVGEGAAKKARDVEERTKTRNVTRYMSRINMDKYRLKGHVSVSTVAEAPFIHSKIKLWAT
jgi:hypothetical protein